MIRSNRGNRGSENDQSGCSRSSSRRSLFPSTGSKNATGSPTWMRIGSPSSPADVPHVREAVVVGHQQCIRVIPDPQTEVLPHLHSLARRRRPSAAGFDEPVGEVRLRCHRPVEVTEGRETSGMSAVVPIQVRLELVAPSPVEIHDRGQVARVHQRDEVVDVRRTSNGRPRSASARGDCGRRWPGSVTVGRRALQPGG